MSVFKYVGPLESVEVPGFGQILQGDTVEFPTDVAKALNPEQWAKATTKKAATKPAVDTPAGENVSA